MRYSLGDILLKRKKASENIYYFINHITETLSGYPAYSCVLYQGDTPFRNHHRRTLIKCDYLEELVDASANDYVDFAVADWEYQSHVSEYPAIAWVEETLTPYEVDAARLALVMEDGPAAVTPSWEFIQTAPPHQIHEVERVGRRYEHLQEDMMLLSEKGEAEQFAEHEDRIMEAIRRGVWLPVSPTAAEIDGRRVTEL